MPAFGASVQNLRQPSQARSDPGNRFNPIKAFDEDLKAAEIPKHTSEGKLDFHSLRVTYTTFPNGQNIRPQYKY